MARCTAARLRYAICRLLVASSRANRADAVLDMRFPRIAIGPAGAGRAKSNLTALEPMRHFDVNIGRGG
ncbi:hypothetical protein FZ025_17655 [Xanthomonas hyacinthi]|uniref:hypothetical protein n=1 Tax=Xanthomonas hyacinthi TaxID=56455 RepID=UPI00062DBD3F|nr:hypothetical protein [Xanthomonas hyacinthi]KLD79004.1 hypothetical protein Y886_06935 [Xanthomonas hyacinthi DSM 19077]QGY78376.1 hypothetical protein FZ025_17655 [Xanthomonas hyacinthi]